MAKFYLTNAIPYVNAKPHIGHAFEFVQSDTIARFHRLIDDETLLLCGGDENAIKNVQAAEEEKTPIQEFVDKNSQLFAALAHKLNVGFDIFQKGSAKNHYLSSQKLWQRCFANGDIYKKEYSGLYCVGCELFYGKKELDKNGQCYEHPGKKLEEVTEENWFFKLSKYEKQLIELIEADKLKIVPQNRKNEALAFLRQGLKDISISRSNERAKNWGVPVPNDPSQRIYVWFDALNIYQSGVGFGWDEKKYNKWWPADLHVIGKGILRFHAVYWPAFLLSAKLELPKALFVHGYLTVNGQKMSKTLGNVVDPAQIIDKYGADALRYYFLKEVSPFDDGDFSEEKLKKVYNADLANGLGNLVARVAKLCENAGFDLSNVKRTEYGIDPEVKKALDQYRFDEAIKLIWDHIDVSNAVIDELKPWKLKNVELKKSLDRILSYISFINYFVPNLSLFLPGTAEKIQKQFKGPKIESQKPLFPRIV